MNASCEFSTYACAHPGVSMMVKHSRITFVTGIFLTAVLLVACSTAAVPDSQVDARPEVVLVESQPLNLPDLYDRVNPAVVNIQVRLSVMLDSNGDAEQPFGSAQGSGFLYDDLGHFVTNFHVVDGVDQISVVFSDGLILDGELIGSDPDSDLAVIRVDGIPSEIGPLPLADSSMSRVGDAVVAIGNPFGLQGTMTTGIISALGRTLPSQAVAIGGGHFNIPNVIQTDAAINPGNSGGPLLNLRGEVVGVNSAIASSDRQFSGVGYAVPSNTVARVIPELIQTGRFRHPYLGLAGVDVSPNIRDAMDLDPQQRGVLVMDVTENGPAFDAQVVGSSTEIEFDGRPMLIGGDIITRIDQQSVGDFDDLIAYLSESTIVGQKVELGLLRNGENISVEIVLGERPTSPN
ncbi:MAG: trypsin-like serine protease [Anaerolineales bacterium]|nr:MAG: trypsin-like serine protease [Anaerolineales bacterium]